MSTQRGFTLLEMMLVLALIAITASMVLFTYGREDARARETAMFFTTSLESVVDRASLSGHPIGIHFSDSGWQIMLAVREETGLQWMPLKEDSSNGVENEWNSEIAVQTQPFKTDDNTKPQVVVLADGQITPFSLLILSPETGNPLITLVCSGTLPLHQAEDKDVQP